MALRGSISLLVVAAAVACGGCTTFNDRFHVPGRDPLMTFLGADYETSQKLWPAAELPALRPMRTELIPDRSPPPGVPPIGWPPL